MNVSELQKLRIKELTELAIKLEIDSYSGMNRQELIVKILEAQMEKDGGITARGVLEVLNEGYGFLRSPNFNYLPGPDDIYVSPSQIKRFGLRTGHEVSGQIRPPKSKERFYALLKVEEVNGKDPDELRKAILFDNLTPLYPEEKLNLFNGKHRQELQNKLSDYLKKDCNIFLEEGEFSQDSPNQIKAKEKRKIQDDAKKAIKDEFGAKVIESTVIPRKSE